MSQQPTESIAKSEETCVLCGSDIPPVPGLPDYDPLHLTWHQCTCAKCRKSQPQPR